MKLRTPAIICLMLAVFALLAGGILFLFRSELRDWWWQRNQEPVPEAVSYADSTDAIYRVSTDTENKNMNTTEKTTNPAPVSVLNANIELPESVNLDVPFTSQAPHANWDLPYQEACEEASALMAARYLQGRPITDAADADNAILQLVDFGTQELGYPIDTTAEETADIIEQFYELDTEVIYDFSWDDVKTSVAQGYPVLVPAAGQQLGNPFFTAPGPPYHMLVIKGYTPSVVITNDPGTRRGADYQYSYDTLYNAIHDWNDGQVTTGKKVMIIVKPNDSTSINQ